MYKKTFKTQTGTSKGVYEIEITLWKESMQPYSSATRWNFDGFVAVNENKFPITAYWSTIGQSTEMMKHFGVPIFTQFKADFSEVISYTQKIDRADAAKSSEHQADYDSMMSNIGL